MSLRPLWRTRLPIGGSRTHIKLGDVDGDGVDEALVSDANEYGPSRYGLVVDGAFQWRKSSPGKVVPSAVADVDGDGTAEIITRDNAGGNWFRPLNGDGSHLWSNRLPDWPDDAAAVDFDGDGQAEVLGVSETEGFFAVWDADGTTLWEGRSARHVENLHGWRDVASGPFPELLTDFGTGESRVYSGVRLCGRSGGEWTTRWDYGPERPAMPAFATIEGETVVLVGDTSGNIDAITTGGERIWRIETSLSEGGFSLLPSTTGSTDHAALFEGSTAVVANTTDRSTTRIETDAKIHDIHRAGDTIVLATEDRFEQWSSTGELLDAVALDTRVRQIRRGNLGGGTDFVLEGETDVLAIGADGRATTPTTTAARTATDRQVGKSTNASEIGPRTQTTAASELDLSAAEVERDVILDGDRYRILRGVPGTAADRFAVTDDQFTLVDPRTARSALVTDLWQQHTFTFDWERAWSDARSQGFTTRMTELLNRAATLGWDALAAYALAQVSPSAALPVAVEALQDSIAWATTEIESPYQETMTKMAQWSYTYRELAAKFESSTHADALPNWFLDFGLAAKGVADSLDDLGSVVSTMRSAYRASGSFTTALTAGGSAAATPAIYYVAGELVKAGVETITAGFEQNAKVAALRDGFNRTRLPVVGRILELVERARAGRLEPANVYELHFLMTKHHYMGAFATYGMHRYVERLQEHPLGSVWNALVGTDRAVAALAKQSDIYRWGGSMAHLQLGQGLKSAQRRADRSLNVAGSGTEVA